MPEYKGFIGGTERGQSLVSSVSRSVNLYVERRTLSGRPALYSWPGQTKFGQAVGVGGRALFEMNNRVLGVMGADVIGIDVNGTVTKFGTVPQDASRAQIIMNGIAGGQALISSATNAYSLNLTTNVLSAAVLTGEADQIGFLDAYGIAFNRTLGRIRLSALNDVSSWDPTMFQGRSSQPDNWQAMLVNAPDVILIGGQTGEIWYDAGSFPFPLAPRPGMSFPWGIAAPDSLSIAGDSVLWVSRNRQGQGIVVRMRGYSPQPFSDPAVEAAIARYALTSRIDDAEGTGIQWLGHQFYILNFPTAQATWFVDLATGEWAELGAWNASRGDFDAWRGRVHCQAFGKHLIAAPGSAVISFLDQTASTEVDGSIMRRYRIPPSLIAHDGKRIFVDSLRLLMQNGVGNVVDPGANPVVMMRISQDFARTWGNEWQASIGPIGATQTEIIFSRCGSSLEAWVPEIVITDPVPVQIVGADILGDNLNLDQAAA